jgi:hypothetical protein
MPTIKPVTPECRYGHGELLRAHVKGAIPEWSLLAAPSANVGEGTAFSLALYICSTCGYAELFDLEPEQTAKDEQ